MPEHDDDVSGSSLPNTDPSNPQTFDVAPPECEVINASDTIPESPINPFADNHGGNGAGAPVTQSSRIASIDVMRGVALLGILVMNIQSFAMPGAAYMNPSAYGDLTGVNYWIWHICHLFADMKFMSIFSMLFGAGLVLMTSRIEAKGRSAAGFHYRRTFFLLLFGLAHCHLLWYGDILVLYAVTAGWLYLFRKIYPSIQIFLAILFLLIFPLMNYSGAWWFGHVRDQVASNNNSSLLSTDTNESVDALEELNSQADPEASLIDPSKDQDAIEAGLVAETDEEQEAGDNKVESSTSQSRTFMSPEQYQQNWDEMNKMWAPSEEEIQEEIAAMTGSYLGELKHRIPQAIGFEIMMIIFFMWRVAAMMLIGMAFFKWGVFSAARSTVFYAVMVVAGFAIGLTLSEMGIQANEADGWTMVEGMFINSKYNYFGSVFTAFGWIGLVMLMCKQNFFPWLQSSLAAVGQMALTNYLLHTIICTMLFYGRSGFGLGWFGEISRTQQVGVFVTIWMAQLLLSPVWMKVFRFGPFEWLWRSLTYGKLQPLFRTKQAA